MLHLATLTPAQKNLGLVYKVKESPGIVKNEVESEEGTQWLISFYPFARK